MIIDVHGHYTTAPKALEDWRNRQIAGIKDPAARPKVSELRISDDELRESIVNNQLKKMLERGSDLTIFSPRASFMAHHIGDFKVSSTWAAICNELCWRVRWYQSQSRPVGRALDFAAAVGPALVPDLREDGGAQHPRHDPRFDQLQRLLSHHGRALPERRHHGFHAMPDL